MTKIKIFNEGEKVEAFCPTCESDVTVTFRYEDYITEKNVKIPNVLQGFCDSCHERLLLPPQSTPKIAPYYAKIKQSEQLEYSVPEVINDVLLNIGYQLKLENPDPFKILLRFYLSKSLSKTWLNKNKVKHLGRAGSRLSYRIDKQTHAKLKQVAATMDISNTQYVMRMIWDAKDRLLSDSAIAKEFVNETKLLRVPEIA